MTNNEMVKKIVSMVGKNQFIKIEQYASDFTINYGDTFNFAFRYKQKDSVQFRMFLNEIFMAGVGYEFVMKFHLPNDDILNIYRIINRRKK